MKVGDAIYFKPPYFIRVVDGVYGSEGRIKVLIGLLIDYQHREKMATVMYNGELLRVPIIGIRGVV